MQVIRRSQQEWVDAGYPGGERAMLHTSAQSGRTSLVRVKAGSHAPRHRHEAGEHVLVLSGRLNIGGHELAAGDYIFTEAGESHDLVAHEDTVFFVSSDRPVHVTGD